jgi:hypothetical protein
MGSFKSGSVEVLNDFIYVSAIYSNVSAEIISELLV